MCHDLAVVCSLIRPIYRISLLTTMRADMWLVKRILSNFFMIFWKFYPVLRTTDSLCNIVAPLPQFDCAPCLSFVHTVVYPPPLPMKLTVLLLSIDVRLLSLSVDRFDVLEKGRDRLPRKVHAGDLNFDCNMYKKKEKRTKIHH